ncbi:hypothetical protein Syun_020590 [Stephania yunnanensis]|uniref:Uncharacterized protein n=1 Tax=Stephania yunnanensis TaxID=152371 RepID=A0AAP0IEW6_9MAGN
MSNYAVAVSRAVSLHHLVATVNSPDEPFSIPTFPWIRLTLNDLEPPFNDPNPSGPLFDHVMEVAMATMNSHGMLVNSFYELEPVFADNIIRDLKLKTWNVGPLSLAVAEDQQQHETIFNNHDDDLNKRSYYMQWLDEMEKEGKSVLYVAFGSQADISKAQIMEIGHGLEKSGVNFMWVVRSSSSHAPEHESCTYKNDDDDDDDDDSDESILLWFGEFEERVRGRGVVVREWVEQVNVLMHRVVRGFMSHCGWNSVVESVCAGVVVVAWPMMAEQHLNARMVVEELGVGVRVTAEGGGVRGFVKAEMVEAAVREVMEGERGKEARRRVEELREGARKAVREGGSSWKALDDLLQEIN